MNSKIQQSRLSSTEKTADYGAVESKQESREGTATTKSGRVYTSSEIISSLGFGSTQLIFISILSLGFITQALFHL